MGTFGKFREIVDPAYNLSNQQLAAIQLAVEGVSWGCIADRLDLNRRTIYNWRHNHPNFPAALDEALAQRRESGDNQMHKFADGAAETLFNILADPTDKQRLRAAQILLNHDIKLRARQHAESQNDSYDDSWPEPELPPKVG